MQRSSSVVRLGVVAAAVLVVLLVALRWQGSSVVSTGGQPSPATNEAAGSRAPDTVPSSVAGEAAGAPQNAAPPAVASTPAPAAEAAKGAADAPDAVPADPAPAGSLTESSTLAQWKVASARERSRIAVEIAQNYLTDDATRLETARLAMEITGCLSATARDPRFQAWTVAPTAETCLSAPEKPEP